MKVVVNETSRSRSHLPTNFSRFWSGDETEISRSHFPPLLHTAEASRPRCSPARDSPPLGWLRPRSVGAAVFSVLARRLMGQENIHVDLNNL